MKKIYLVSTVTIIAGLIFSLYPYWFRSMWGPQILLIPFIAGILMVLVQDEDKSYNYLAKLLIGSTLTSFIYAIVLFIVNHFKYLEYNNTPLLEKMDVIEISMFALPLIALCMFGGLIGLVIRGSRLLLSKNKINEKI